VLAENCGSKNVLTSKPRHPPRRTKLKAKFTGSVKHHHHQNVSAEVFLDGKVGSQGKKKQPLLLYCLHQVSFADLGRL
jgi:hypothetical protein